MSNQSVANRLTYVSHKLTKTYQALDVEKQTSITSEIHMTVFYNHI